MSIDLLKKEVINDLQKSGFPTEVEISNIIDKNGWMISVSLFEDTEESISREIDIHAMNIDYSFFKKVPKKVVEGNENKLISHLIIEVKKSEKGWVFFNNGQISWPWISPQNYKSLREDFHYLMIEDLKKLGLKKHRFENGKLHKSYHVSFSKPSQPSVIYESLIKTSKATKYFKRIFGTGKYVLHNFIPMIVLDGNLWSASLNKNGKVHLDQVDSLLVVHSELTTFRNRKLKLEEKEICEVVTKQEFNKYLKNIMSDNKEIYKAWTTFINQKQIKK